MDFADNLARTITSENVREARGLTQAQIAKLAGVPRPTWSTLESGAGNPTLSVLVKVAGALALTLEELLSAPREACRLYRAKELITRERASGQALPIELRQLLPDALPGLSLERMALPPRGRMSGVPHRAGTREYLACESGALQLTVAGQEFHLAPGAYRRGFSRRPKTWLCQSQRLNRASPTALCYYPRDANFRRGIRCLQRVRARAFRARTHHHRPARARANATAHGARSQRRTNHLAVRQRSKRNPSRCDRRRRANVQRRFQRMWRCDNHPVDSA